MSTEKVHFQMEMFGIADRSVNGRIEGQKVQNSSLEFFVCNGGRDLAGVRKKSDPKHIIFVKDPDIAQNLDMQIAKAACNGGRFGVRMGADGIVYFVCAGAEMEHNENFKAVSKTDWKKYSAYLDK